MIDTVLTQLAAAEACLTPDEKELGVALVDIGGGTTDLAIFEKGSLWHTAVLQVGGEHFTNDVAVALRTPVNEAEKIKKKHGCALDLDDPGGGLDRGAERGRPQAADHGPPGAGRRAAGAGGGDLPDGAHRDPPRGLRPQPEQRRRADRRRRRSSRACPRSRSRSSTCRCGAARPSGIGGLVDVVASPVYSTAVGLVLCGYRNRAGRGARRRARQAATGTFGKVTGRLMGWLSDFF